MDPWRILQHKGGYTKCNDRGSQITRRGVYVLVFLCLLALCGFSCHCAVGFLRKGILERSSKMQQCIRDL